MQNELHVLAINKTWSVFPLPPGKHTIGCKWIYKLKFKSDGFLDRHKARLVAKGYTQQEDVDFVQTFSPVAKLVTVKVLLAIATSQNWNIIQLDVNNAFLHGDLFEEAYMDLPFGYNRQGEHVSSNGNSGMLVCHLHKSIYCLKQASRQWYSKFSQCLLHHGFHQSKADYSFFTKGSGSTFVAFIVYVDDITIASPSLHIVNSLKAFLHSKFKFKDLGDLKYFLGLEIAKSTTSIVLSQHNYILQLLENTGFLAYKPTSVPMDPKLHLNSLEGDVLFDIS